MNEKGQIVEYQLTKSTRLSEARHLLERIRDRLSRPLTLIIADNCCLIAKTLKKIFGEQLSVKLDLFRLQNEPESEARARGQHRHVDRGM